MATTSRDLIGEQECHRPDHIYQTFQQAHRDMLNMVKLQHTAWQSRNPTLKTVITRRRLSRIATWFKRSPRVVSREYSLTDYEITFDEGLEIVIRGGKL